MLDFEFVIFYITYFLMICYLLFMIIICLGGIRIYTNQEDLDQETFETPVINQTHPPYLHLVDFTHLGQRFSNSDLPPSYENCILESQPPSYSIV